MSSNEASTELPKYKCHKTVWALKIATVLLTKEGGAILATNDHGYAPWEVDSDYVTKHQPEAGGYYVVYEDGYKSFSPAEAFEAGYSRL